ncbi:hypothetical protein FACS1894200_05480 [Spirochaetia bacterium]|nr:hypothetical protein FACS1894200_05480 [Spirochaetia bacterium]
MNLYHGSYIKVDKPRTNANIRGLDFGSGFYLTSSEKQAKEFALRVVAQDRTFEILPVSTLNSYDFDITLAKSECAVQIFETASIEWFDFVVTNRKNKNSGAENKMDIIIGPVANDQVITTIRLFEADIIEKEDAIKRLKTQRLVDQVVLKTEKALKYLTFINSYEVIRDEK